MTNDRLAGMFTLALWLALILFMSFTFVSTRFFHVDEIGIIYSTRLISGSMGPFKPAYCAPYLAPFVSMAPLFPGSWNFLMLFRWISFAFFCFNLILISLAQPFFRSFNERALVLLASTMIIPLWIHGFEFRHDQIILTSSIALFILTLQLKNNPRPMHFYWSGFIVIFCWLNSSVKSLAYMLPFLLVFTACAVYLGKKQGIANKANAKHLSFIILGAVSAALISVITMTLMGQFHNFQHQILSYFQSTSEAGRFSPNDWLLPWLFTNPVFLCLAILSLLFSIVDIFKKHVFIHYETTLASTYFLWTFIVLFINPQPYKYNSILFFPFLLIAGFAGIRRLPWVSNRGRLILFGVLLLPNVWLFSQFTVRIMKGSAFEALNLQQKTQIRLAELLTDPKQDPVIDGMGLVNSRMPPGDDWVLHSLLMGEYRQGLRTPFGKFFTVNPAPVIISNYRIRWLNGFDKIAFEQNYTPYLKELEIYLLTHTLEANHTTHILRTGRYQVDFQSTQTDPFWINEQELRHGSVIFLEKGQLNVKGLQEQARVNLIWIGPYLKRLPNFHEAINGNFMRVTNNDEN